MLQQLKDKYGSRLHTFKDVRDYKNEFKHSLFFRIDGEYIGYVDGNDDRGVMGVPYIEVYTGIMQLKVDDPIRFTDIDKFVEGHSEGEKGDECY